VRETRAEDRDAKGLEGDSDEADKTCVSIDGPLVVVTGIGGTERFSKVRRE
jgi:hypothetical protein